MRRVNGATVGRSVVRQEELLDVVAVGLEQHVGAAQLTNLLLRPLDHAVALAALGVQHFAGGGREARAACQAAQAAFGSAALAFSTIA